MRTTKVTVRAVQEPETGKLGLLVNVDGTLTSADEVEFVLVNHTEGPGGGAGAA